MAYDPWALVLGRDYVLGSDPDLVLGLCMVISLSP